MQDDLAMSKPSGAKTPGGLWRSLKIGIKRRVHRKDDAGAKNADREFDAVRKTVLRDGRWSCAVCGWKSERQDGTTSLQVHHLNDDHTDNSVKNLVPLCPLDHNYHHIGCDAPSLGGNQGIASQMRIAAIPWLSTRDANLLQMAVGAAWLDAQTKGQAEVVYEMLAVMCKVVQDGWGTFHAKDFAAAMSKLTDQQYENRRVDSLRLVFHPAYLQEMGRLWQKDYPMFAPSAWSALKAPRASAHDAV